MKVRQYQPAFTRGEYGDNLKARKDLDSYNKGAARLRNAYVATQGGAYKREGLKYVATIGQGRLVSFAFNTEQEYVLVFMAGQFRVYKDDVLQATVSSSPISALTLAQIQEMTTVQSADTLFLFHKDVQPIRITRSGHTTWTAASQSFGNIPTFDFGSGAEAVISSTRGWPRCGAFYEGRLWLGGLRSRPQTMLASQVGDYFNLAKGTGLDNEAIDITIDDDRVNAILNLFPGRTLFVMTTGGEFGIQAQLGEAVTPAKIPQQLNKLTLHGSYPVSPISVDGSVLFVERSGRVVRQLKYDLYEESYTAREISNFSPHLIRLPVRMDTRSATIKLSANFSYLVNGDGTVAVLNIVADQNLLGWTLFETDGAFEDVAVLNQTDVYFIVARTVNGSVVRYLEKLDPEYNVDCGIKKTRATLANADFGNGLTGWTSHIDAGGTVTATGNQLNLGIAAPGDSAAAEQALTLEAVPYNLYVDVSGAPVTVTVGTSSGGTQVASAVLQPGQGGVVSFTPGSGGTHYIRFQTSVANAVVDNLVLQSNRWTGLSVLEGETVKAKVAGRVAEDAVVTSGQVDLSLEGNSLELGLMFAPVLSTLPPYIADQSGNNLVGRYARLVSVDMDLLETEEVVVEANGKRYKPPFRRFNTDSITQALQPYTGWKECNLGGFAKDCQLTITQDSPVGWNVLAVNVAVGV